MNMMMPYDDPSNAVAAKTRIKSYICPADVTAQIPPNWAPTSYRVNQGNGISWGIPSGGNAALPPPDGPFYIDSAVKLVQITDGTSNTAMVSEHPCGSFNAGVTDPNNVQRLGQAVGLYPTTPDEAYAMCQSVGWQNPAYNGMSDVGAPWTYGYHATTVYFHVGPPNSRSCMYPGGRIGTAARSRHGGGLDGGIGVNVAMCDGSVRFVANSIPLDTWRAMGSRNGGEVVAMP
jgi:prepilin-type processing-associated H-X9-DG protein